MDDIEFQKVLARHIFGNPDEAAIHALSRIAEPNYELGGVIFRDAAGRHTYTEPTGNKKTGQFELRVGIPQGQKLAGIYHTHPTDGIGDSSNERFSPDDVAIADRLKVMSYIKALKSGNLRRYEPGVTRTRRIRSPDGSNGRVSDGELMRQALAQELMRDPLDIARQSK